MNSKEELLWDAYVKEEDADRRMVMFKRWARESNKEMVRILVEDIGWITRQKDFTKDAKEETINLLIETIQAIRGRR
jgi:hypothetical protein